ncbi:hypothetical protein CkaCkLH20_12829 [Colletotrichum karsti]|uniref:Amidase domain-containing protein n=1 Tax=Colletotrichum karsti TaxID=1095194 RepID=A0A9P6LEV5_9PEZI|nr:uncharacterized protein CkaCkLH20_12829 [Colletotrichum karsti]KAF9869642.1 hypothetical protein CkaCkLH20_12829 [Colletotrichum karsti]
MDLLQVKYHSAEISPNCFLRPYFTMEHSVSCSMTASEVRRLILSGSITLETYVWSLLRQLENEDQYRGIKAWAHIKPYKVLEEARRLDKLPRDQRGPLHGFVIGVKDAILTEDFPTTYGSPIHANDGPLHDAASVAVLRRNGALIMGKTTTTEFTATFEGPGTRNPRDISRTPGGSSSGSAAAVASMQVPIALCTQTVGSTIRPASFTGVYAFKPTWNAISAEGQKVSSPTLDTFAVMARSVTDLQHVSNVLGLRDDEPRKAVSLSEATFAFVKSPVWPTAGPGTVAAMERAAKILTNAGAQVVNVTLPSDFDDILSLQNEILEAEIGVAFHKEYTTRRSQISDYLASIARTSHTGSKKAYLRALDRIAALRPIMDDIADQYTAIVTPSAIDVAPKGTGTGSSDFNAMWTALHSPVINIPGFQGEDNMPVGLSLVTSSTMEDKPNILPPNIHSQYLRYKANTKLFLNWLFSESKKIMKPKLLPREATGLCTQHLLPMAQACKSAAVAMPPIQRSYLQQAIDLRRKVGKYYVSGGSQSAVATDDGHKFFTNCLDRILDMFPAAPSASSPRPPSPPSSAPAPDPSFTNKFGLLNVEDYEDTGPEGPRPKPATPATPSPPTAKDKLFDLIDDSGVELICLLNDIREIRLYLQGIWANYQARKLDLVSAALVTEAAFECIGIMDENFGQVNPELQLMPAIVAAIVKGSTAHWPNHLHLCLAKDGPCVQDDSQPAGGQSEFRPYVGNPHVDFLSEWLMAPAFNMMVGLAEQAKHPDMPSLWPDDADYQMLRELEAHSVHLTRGREKHGFWRLDRLMLYLWQPQNEGIHLTTVALSTIMLDLRKMDGLFAMVTDDYDLFCRKFPHDFYDIDPPDNQLHRENKHDVGRKLAWLRPEDNFPSKECIKINPVLAGLTIFIPYQKVLRGIIHTTSWDWCLMPMAHIYNYARAKNSWPLQWADMEALITMQGREIFSDGELRPTNIKICENRFYFANGGTSNELTAIRKNRKTTLFEVMKETRFNFPRKLPINKETFEKGAMSWHQADRIFSLRNTSGFRREFHPTPVLSEVYWQYERPSEEGETQGRFGISANATSRTIKKHVEKCLKGMNKPVRRELTVPQFLEGFLAIAQLEVSHMVFDFYGMEYACLLVLEEVHAELVGSLPEMQNDLDRNLFVDVFFDDYERKQVEFKLKKVLGRKGENRPRTDIAREWERFCKKLALFPRSEYGWDAKYNNALQDRLTASAFF